MGKKVIKESVYGAESVNPADEIPVESHPWPPFIPDGAKVVLMGTFPPTENRWAMKFFYPNRTNDFWRILSLIFLGDPEACYDKNARAFRVDELKQLLTDHKIALAATTIKVRRLKGNASDKDLEIVEMVDLPALLAQIPDCRAIATTGEKAASVIATLTDTPLPKIGEPLGYIPTPLPKIGKPLSNTDTPLPKIGEPLSNTHTPRPKIGEPLSNTDSIAIWRLPSTSRAYPLPLAKKAEYYAAMFRSVGLLPE